MDYIPYLSPSSIEIHQLAIQKARIIEDGEPCRRYDIFGFFRRSEEGNHNLYNTDQWAPESSFNHQ